MKESPTTQTVEGAVKQTQSHVSIFSDYITTESEIEFELVLGGYAENDPNLSQAEYAAENHIFVCDEDVASR